MNEMNVHIEIELHEGTKSMSPTMSFSDSVHEALCLTIHEANDEAHQWLTDNVKNVTVHDSIVRNRMHEALDKLLDAIDAGGYDQEEVTITVQAVDIETMDNDRTVLEDIGYFSAEFASGELEDMFNDHYVYKNGKQVSYSRHPVKEE